MKSNRNNKGPWSHRALVYCLTVVFGLLVYWFLSFVVRDIASWEGPTYELIEKRMLDQELAKELALLQNSLDETNRAIANRKGRQVVLRDSTDNSERTMNRLLELQKLTIERGLAPSPEEAKALAESQNLFLANQTKYQDLNDQIATLSNESSALESRQRAIQKKLDAQRPAAQREFDRQASRHQLKLAAMKLSILVPLLGLAVGLLLKKRAGLYGPLLYGFGLAVVSKAALVMHEHFPTRYFKYVLVLVGLLLVARVLVYLLRAMAFPKLDWLLRQYREAYEHFLCPVCSFPIRRGSMRDLFWTRSSVRKLKVNPSSASDTDCPYVCPVCATRLFEPCPSCNAVRHSLLPACTHCGAEKALDAALQSTARVAAASSS